MKRLTDIVLTVLIFLLVLPLLILLFLLVRLKICSQVLFVQARPGLNGNIFNMYKFRTMTDKCDNSGVLLPDYARLKNFGRFLRSTSLDELPELWNVLKGEMSLVGPRPLLIEYFYLFILPNRSDVTMFDRESPVGRK